MFEFSFPQNWFRHSAFVEVIPRIISNQGLQAGWGEQHTWQHSQKSGDLGGVEEHCPLGTVVWHHKCWLCISCLCDLTVQLGDQQFWQCRKKASIWSPTHFLCDFVVGPGLQLAEREQGGLWTILLVFHKQVSGCKQPVHMHVAGYLRPTGFCCHLHTWSLG